MKLKLDSSENFFFSSPFIHLSCIVSTSLWFRLHNWIFTKQISRASFVSIAEDSEGVGKQKLDITKFKV